MVPAQTRPVARVTMLAAAGVFVALGWVLLTAIIGWGASFAHADDDTDRGGLLGTVTGVVGSTATAVTSVAADVLQTTSTAVIAPVVQTVTTAVPQTAPVVSTVTDTVQAVSTPIRELVDTGVVSGIVTPVVGVVQSVPVLGQIVTTLGADTALTDVATTVDGTLSGVVGAVDGSVESIAPPLTVVPGVIAPGATPGHGQAPPIPGDTLLVPAASLDFFDATDRSRHARVWAPSAAVPLAVPGAASSPLGGPTYSSSSPPGLCAPWGGSSTGSGGTGPGAAALLAFAPFAAHRAWVRRSGSTDDDAPPAPTFATDVSPD